MMQSQTDHEGSKFNAEVPQRANAENIQLIIDFDNIEDILDFSLHSPTEAPNGDKQRPPRLRKLVAQEPVKLLELKPIIDNYVDDEIQHEIEHDADSEIETKSRRFQCIVCGNKFIRSTHLHRHMRLHTGVKPYACFICRKRFSRSDYMSTHAHSHYADRLHCCCVCGEVYDDLARFADHCRSHDDSEYIRIAMSNTKDKSRNQVQVVEDEIPVTIAAKKIELNSCVKIEKVNNSTDEECIVCIQNPIYASHDQTISNNNDVTSVNSTATMVLHSTSTNDGTVAIQ